MRDWYVIYDGQSEDGRGHPSYRSRTYSRRIAEGHAKRMKKNPYCNGYVIWLHDKKEERL